MITRIESDFCVEYRLDGYLHRPNGPALIWNDGWWSWRLYGKEHRYYGTQSLIWGWFIHGERIKVAEDV